MCSPYLNKPLRTEREAKRAIFFADLTRPSLLRTLGPLTTGGCDVCSSRGTDGCDDLQHHAGTSRDQFMITSRWNLCVDCTEFNRARIMGPRKAVNLCGVSA